MNILNIIILCFSAFAVMDLIFGNRIGLGKEFKKAFMLMGSMSLSMIGMIVISPLISEWIRPFTEFISDAVHIDGSIIPASIFAIDMGGAPLCTELAQTELMGLYNGIVVASMLGCTVSFTIPFAMGVVKSSQHKELSVGILCGIVTIPIGCFISGLFCNIPLISLVLSIIPLMIQAVIISVSLILFPQVCIKIFKGAGFVIETIVLVGLFLGIINFLCGREVINCIATIEDGVLVCLNCSVVLSGTFPIIFLLSKVLSKPLNMIGNKVGLDETSVLGIVSSLASSTTTFAIMDKMESKGVIINSAFSVSGAFTFGAHLAFAMVYNAEFVLPMIIGKLIAGILAIILSSQIYEKILKTGDDLE